MGSVRRRLEQHPELLALSSEAVLYAVLGRIADALDQPASIICSRNSACPRQQPCSAHTEP